MRGRANLILINGVVVLILIILEVLYESVLVKLKLNFVVVLILIILEVLYEPLGIRAISLLGLVS